MNRNNKDFRKNSGSIIVAKIIATALVASMSSFAGAQVLRHHPLPQAQTSTPAIATAATVTPQGTWTPLVNLAPEHIATMMLLSDGTVLANGFGDNTWYTLTPDRKGSYVNGTWSQAASMDYQRQYFQSDVLPSGKIFVSGGEDGNAPSGSTELYDPVAKTWSELPSATSADPGMNSSDGSSMVLNDGKVLVNSVVGTLCPNYGKFFGGDTLIFNPADSTWSASGCTLASEDETTWVKLKDGSILALDISSTTSERYIPSLAEWVADAPPPVNLYNPSGELGGAYLLPNGKVFYIGGTNQTLIYTPSGNSKPGSWVLGPTVPDEDGMAVGANDAPSAMMANGKILLAEGGYLPPCNYCNPTYFFTYDYRTNAITAIDAPDGGASLDSPTFGSDMLDLPDGSVLFTNSFPQLYTFKPAGGQLEAGEPQIYSVTKNHDGSYYVSGTGFNGISGGANYGDENQNATNYPIASLTDIKGNVYYARTYNWSSTAVATGNLKVSTEMALPAGLPHGIYLLTISANGIKSEPSLASIFLNF